MIEMKPLDTQTSSLAEGLVGQYCRDLSDGTLKKYKANNIRLGGRHWRDYAIENQLKQNTAQVYRAAWCFHRAHTIKQILDGLKTETRIESLHLLYRILPKQSRSLETADQFAIPQQYGERKERNVNHFEENRTIGESAFMRL